MQQVSLGELFSDAELKKVAAVYENAISTKISPHDNLVEAIKPLIPEIEKRSGRKFNLDYLAYAVEYCLSRLL